MSRSASPRRNAKNGTWYFIVDLPNADGTRKQAKRRGFRTKAEAQAALDDLRVSSRQGTYIAPDRQTLAVFLEQEWLPAVKRRIADTTWESYERNVRHHIVPRLGRLPLQSLDGGVLNRLY